MNILHLTPDFNYSDGRSYYVFLLLKYLKRAGHNVFLCTNGGDSLDRLYESEIPVFTHSQLSDKTSILNSIKFVSNLVSSKNIDIVHSHHRYYELLANSVAAGGVKCRTVFTALSIVAKRFFVEYKSDRIIAVSNCVKEMLTRKFHVNENRISLIPNFADSEELITGSDPFAGNSLSNEKTGGSDDFTNILSIGRFHKEKNFETLLEAFTLLRDHKIKLTMIGEGEEMNKYLNIIEEKSICAEIIPPQRNLSRFFNIADICVLPSVRDPLPGFMLQSGLYSKPFIGSDADGIAEVIKNGENGLLFEKKNVFQLSEKIKIFIGDKLFAGKCAENLNNLVIEKYTEKSVIPEIIKLYNRLLN